MKNSVILLPNFHVSRSREIFIEAFIETFTDSEFHAFLTPHVKIRQDDNYVKKAIAVY